MDGLLLKDCIKQKRNNFQIITDYKNGCKIVQTWGVIAVRRHFWRHKRQRKEAECV